MRTGGTDAITTSANDILNLGANGNDAICLHARVAGNAGSLTLLPANTVLIAGDKIMLNIMNSSGADYNTTDGGCRIWVSGDVT